MPTQTPRYRVHGVLKLNGAEEVFTVAAKSPQDAEGFANRSGLLVSHVVQLSAEEEAALERRVKERPTIAKKVATVVTLVLLSGASLFWLTRGSESEVEARNARVREGPSGGGTVDLGNGYEVKSSDLKKYAQQGNKTEQEALGELRDLAALKEAARQIKDREEGRYSW